MAYLNGLGVALLETGRSTQSFLGSSTGLKTLIGGIGNDAFRGYSYVDTYVGGKGDDTYYISNRGDKVVELAGEGIDTVWAEQNHKLGANVENLVLNSGNAWYGEGNALDNILISYPSGATLNGGAGNDVLVAKGNNMTFVVAKGNGSDAIYGWDATDKIRLDGYGITNFAGIKSLSSQVGNDTVLKFGNGEQLVLRDTKAASLTADNFYYAQDRAGLVQTFADDFNSLSLYSKGGTWRTEYGHGGTGSLASRTLPGEAEIYMDADYAGTGKKALGINPFKIDSGILTITAAPTPDDAKAALGGAAYTSGLLTTKYTYAQQYGYFEIKAQLPVGQGAWPAFWLMPTDGSWPPELDVFETLGRDPDTLYMTSHGVDANGVHTQTQSKTSIDYTQWHTYGADWGPNTITYYVDGMAVATQATPDAMKGKNMYMMVNLAIGGGSWAGSWDATTGTREMKVDYIRAFATSSTLSTTVNGVTTPYTAAATTTTTPTVTTPTVTVTTPTVVAPVTPTPVVEVAKQLLGTAGADTLVATANLTQMFGLAGDDSFRPGAFSATMTGGLGNDYYYIEAANQIIVEAPGEGADSVRSTISYTLPDNVETLVLLGTASINGTGNDGGVKIIGNTGSNVITGGAGNDTLDGGTAGQDTLVGGKGDDTYYVNHLGTTVVEKAGEGIDNVRSTISWTLGENFETLVLEGTDNINATGNNAGNRLIGNTGNNGITGGTGNDILDGGTAGFDVLMGGKGNDLYYVNHIGTTLVEKADEGLDTVQTTISWTLGANFENLTLAGTAAINGTGNALDNRIVGNTAANVITGGAGNDTLTGGGGRDTFVFDKGFGKDIVTDFSTADDFLQFTGYAKAQLHLTQVGANTVIDFGGADTITLYNVQANDPTLMSHLLF